MLFDHRPIDSIEDREIEDLVVQHYQERQHAEYKLTVDLSDEKSKVELLKDVASMANSGGGYIFIGIRDDGKGCAQKFEPVAVGDTSRIAKSIRDLTLSGIAERIEGLDIRERLICGNPIVIVRVPASNRTPHMVSLNNRAEFYGRYQDGKRAMSMAEIREMFNQDESLRMLKFIEERVNQLVTYQPSVAEAALVAQDTANKQRLLLAKQLETKRVVVLPPGLPGEEAIEIYYEGFKRRVKDKPAFWISAAPARPTERKINPTGDEFYTLFSALPGSRNSGWNLRRTSPKIERLSRLLIRGDDLYGELSLDEYNHMEFWTHLDETFCYQQSESEYNVAPRLYPYAVTENPVSFLRFYKHVIQESAYSGEFIVAMRYVNIKGFVLPPFSPYAVGWGFSDLYSKPFPGDELQVDEIYFSENFSPDEIGLRLLEDLYRRFGLSVSDIPFFNPATKMFSWSR